ncbi:MAG: pirin family protein [Burkholderiaceae bacterium]
MPSVRQLEKIIRAQKTSDGAGVSLYRSIGSSQGRVDPFLMLDEFSTENPNDYIAGFPAHPHRGFETVTYMIEGHMLHEDHLGNKGHLRSGDVQWMTAGRGIIHSEMPQQEQGAMRGFQLWINLPASEKMKPAGYRDIPSQDIPVIQSQDGPWVKVIAGDYEGLRGPIQGVSTQPLFIDVKLSADGVFEQTLPPEHAAMVYVFEGELAPSVSLPQALPLKHAAVFGPGDQLQLQASSQGARFLLLAARPLKEPVVQYGPFVMNTREEIEQAISDYQSGRLAA